MKKTAAQLAVHALEQLGITHTFGIPGVHNTELYDALAQSRQITPLLVTHEGGGAFMADAFSRLNWGGIGADGAARAIGTLAIVPAAGLTHAASGIGEAYLAGIPMLVLTGGTRTDSGRRYQLHGIDQLEMARGFTKAAFRVTGHAQVVPTLFEAYRIATSGVPGPVLVELPVNLQIFSGDAGAVPEWQAAEAPPLPDAALIRQAADVLQHARQPGLFVGWGARHAQAELVALAELLQMPVSTTLQGLAVFPGDHPLHAGFGFSRSAVPAAQNAFRQCDALLAVGARFAEIPTGSFGARVPQALVHVDIDPEVPGANYPAQVALVGDAQPVLRALLDELRNRKARRDVNSRLQHQIASDKAAYLDSWLKHGDQTHVNPAAFFASLRRQMPADSITVLDDGNHTFLAAELYSYPRGSALLTPSDFNAMGYAVPAAIGARLAQPQREVVAIVGDGGFAMSCMEIMTATANGLGVIFCVFNDGALAQIAQAQQLPYQRLTCTTLPHRIGLQGVAQATGAAYVPMPDNHCIDSTIAEARKLAAQGRPVIVDVAIDYSRQTTFTQGTTKTNFRSFPLGQKLRFLRRIVGRKLRP